MTIARLIFSIGIPGSGKTAILKRLAEKLSAAYISPDNIRVELLGKVDDHSKDKEVWVLARSRVAGNLKMGRTVVFDSTFSRPDLRHTFIEGGQQAGATSVEGIFFDMSQYTFLQLEFDFQERVGSWTRTRHVKITCR